MLKNIKSKNIEESLIIPPKQINSNCWFNCFFMAFFISDKGRKFFRYLRETMVKGVFPSGKEIPQDLRKSFFMLNRFIDSSLIGYADANLFAEKMDTNSLIKSISQELKKKWSRYRIYEDRGNPITYYKRITEYLNDDTIKLMEIKNRMPVHKDIKHFKKQNSKIPELIITVFYKNKKIKKLNLLKLGTYKYRLDSAVLRNISQTHFSAYITLNNNLYAYDGQSFSRLMQFDWKDKINADFNFSLAQNENGNPIFNFTNGYQMLFYYRIK